MGIIKESIATESMSGAVRCAFFFIAAFITAGVLESYQVLNVKSIAVETVMFTFVMVVGDISNPRSRAYKFDDAGLARVALFIMLAVLPAFANHLIQERDSSRLFHCLLQGYQGQPTYDFGKNLVIVLMVGGSVFSWHTALKLRKYEIVTDKEYSGISALISSAIAVSMLTIYLFLNHLHDEVVSCYDVNSVRWFLFSALGYLFIYVVFVATLARHVSVYFLIPLIQKIETPSGRATIASKSLFLNVFLLLTSALAIYYWDDLQARPILLLLFGLFLCYIISMVVRAFFRWKNYYPHMVLILIATLLATGAGYLVGVYLMSRSGEELIEIQLDEETIEYLKQQ